MGSDRSLLAIGVGILVTAALSVAVVVAVGNRPPASFPSGTPERTLQEYLEAWEDEDYEAAYEFFSSKVRAAVTVEAFRDSAEQQEQFGYLPEGFEPHVLLDRVESEGDRASIYLTVETSLLGVPFVGDIRTTRVIHCVREEGTWKIDDQLLGLEPSPFFFDDIPGEFPPGSPEPTEPPPSG